jgi:hypothetical protein
MPQAFGTGFTSSHRKHKLQGQVLIIIHHCLRYLSFIVMLLPSQTTNFKRRKEETKSHVQETSNLLLPPSGCVQEPRESLPLRAATINRALHSSQGGGESQNPKSPFNAA